MQSIRRAFTLIETLLSISVGMALMLAAAFYFYGLTQAYVRVEEDPLFDDHVESLCALLESFIGATRQSPMTWTEESSNNVGGSPIRTSAAPSKTKRKGKGDLRWETAPGGGLSNEFLLAFTPQNPSFFFSGLPGPLPTFDGYLAFVPKEGLFLIYQTPIQKKESSHSVSVFLLSASVKALDYAFYDDKLGTWSFDNKAPAEASEDKPKLPAAIRLVFEEAGHESTRYIYLPEQAS